MRSSRREVGGPLQEIRLIDKISIVSAGLNVSSMSKEADCPSSVDRGSEQPCLRQGDQHAMVVAMS